MIELSEGAREELAHYRKTGEIDTTGELYYEMYELYANDIDVRVREDEELQYDYVMHKVKELL